MSHVTQKKTIGKQRVIKYTIKTKTIHFFGIQLNVFLRLAHSRAIHIKRNLNIKEYKPLFKAATDRVIFYR